MTPKKATIRDVAREAGVSIGAVSKVLHDRGDTIRVSPAKAEHIRKVAQKLGYVPAVSIRRNRKRYRIALITPADLPTYDRSPYYGDLIATLRNVLLSLDHELLYIRADGESPRPLDGLETRCDAGIWCRAECTRHFWSGFARAKFPVAVINNYAPAVPKQGVLVGIDDDASIRLGLREIAKRGHTTVDYLDVPDTGEYPHIRVRRKAFEDECQKLGVKGQVRIIPADEWLRLWDQTGRIATAVLCQNDEIANRLLVAAHRSRIYVPEELSVVGHDNTKICDWTAPGLTSVHMPMYEICQRTIHHLLERIRNPRLGPVEERLSPGFTLRESLMEPHITATAGSRR